MEEPVTGSVPLDTANPHRGCFALKLFWFAFINRVNHILPFGLNT